MEISGLPLHPLVVHAAVVLIPATALATILFAVLPSWRWLSRWPTAAGSVVCVGIAFLATQSGESLEEQRGLAEAVRVHSHRGALLADFTILLAVVVLAASVMLPGPSGLASGKGAMARRVAYADRILPVLLIVVAVVVLVQTVLTGDAGARAVWAGE